MRARAQEAVLHKVFKMLDQSGTGRLDLPAVTLAMRATAEKLTQVPRRAVLRGCAPLGPSSSARPQADILALMNNVAGPAPSPAVAASEEKTRTATQAVVGSAPAEKAKDKKRKRKKDKRKRQNKQRRAHDAQAHVPRSTQSGDSQSASRASTVSTTDVSVDYSQFRRLILSMGRSSSAGAAPAKWRRYWVAVSLAEAETLRRVVHQQAAAPGGKHVVLALRNLAGEVIDRCRCRELRSAVLVLTRTHVYVGRSALRALRTQAQRRRLRRSTSSASSTANSSTTTPRCTSCSRRSPATSRSGLARLTLRVAVLISSCIADPSGLL